MSELIMPKMGDAMTEGKVIRWYKKAGDTVKKGEPVLEIETDKVNLDLEAETDGTLGEPAAGEGQMVPVGGILANILAPGKKEEARPPQPKPEPKPESKQEPKPESKQEPKPEPKQEPKPESKQEPKPESKQEPKPESKQEPKPESKQEAKPESKQEPQPEAEPQRRATDRKDSIKHTTGEYAEAIETKGPRVDRAAAPSPGTSVVSMPPADAGGRRRSSPLARKMAREMGVSLDAVQGSGPGGRIVARDIEKGDAGSGTQVASGRTQAADRGPQVAGGGTPVTDRGPQVAEAPEPMQPAPALQDQHIPLSAMRRTIAKRLAESTGPIPHFYLTVDYDVTNLLSLRQQLIDISRTKISLNDFIIRAAALALRHHPNVNASWSDDAIAQHGEVHIGVAVSTPEGLITPVVRNADQKSVPQIAEEVRSLVEKVKNRKLTPNEYQGSTFTISNLGAWGIEEFTAIINPPNAAILAIGAAAAQPVVIDRQVVVRDRMKVTMSCDHRLVDGAAGAEYLRTLRQYIEQPLRLVV